MEPFIVEKKKGRVLGRGQLEKVLVGMDDGFYKVTVKKLRNDRTNQQNRWLWGQIYPRLLDGFVNLGWCNMTSEEDVHEYCLINYAGKDVVNPDTGEITTLPKRSSQMDTVEFSLYVTQLMILAQDMGVTIPQPNSSLLTDN